MRSLVALLMLTSAALAQPVPPVRPTADPPPGPGVDVILMSAAYFVHKNCKNLDVDTVTLKALFDMHGLDIDELRGNAVKQRMMTLMVNSWEAKAALNCRQSWELFGPNGTKVKGLVIRRRP